jgi:ribosome modulation factor
MDHRIPATGFHLNYVAAIDGVFTDECPYQQTGTTASRFKDGGTEVAVPQGWRNTWDPLDADAAPHTRFRTELRNADGTLLRFWRHLVSETEVDCDIFIVRDRLGGGEETLVGPSHVYFTKVSDELPVDPEQTVQVTEGHGRARASL